MESNEPRPGSGIRKPQLDVDPAMPADPNNVVCFGGQVRGMTTWSWKTRRASIASNHLVRCGRTPLSSRHSANHRQAKTALQMSARVRCSPARNGRSAKVSSISPKSDDARSWWRRIASASRSSGDVLRSEEHTSELQSLMRISYAVFCLKKKRINQINHTI